MDARALVLILLVVGAALSREIRSCNSCGPECMNTCGTRNFKTCCLNYVKKRSMTDPLPLAMDPSLRLELWLARSRNPYYQRSYDEVAMSQERQDDLAS